MLPASWASFSSVGFGFYDAEEIRKRSVKEVTSPYSFDVFRQPVEGGLYDTAFGATAPLERCVTCRESYDNCPGHAGHIELSVPVYYPFLFTDMYKLLKRTCFYCHKLRCSALLARLLGTLLMVHAHNQTEMTAQLHKHFDWMLQNLQILKAWAEAEFTAPTEEKEGSQEESEVQQMDIEKVGSKKAGRKKPKKKSKNQTWLEGEYLERKQRIIGDIEAAQRWLRSPKSTRAASDEKSSHFLHNTVYDYEFRKKILKTFFGGGSYSTLFGHRCVNCGLLNPGVKVLTPYEKLGLYTQQAKQLEANSKRLAELRDAWGCAHQGLVAGGRSALVHPDDVQVFCPDNGEVPDVLRLNSMTVKTGPNLFKWDLNVAAPQAQTSKKIANESADTSEGTEDSPVGMEDDAEIKTESSDEAKGAVSPEDSAKDPVNVDMQHSRQSMSETEVGKQTAQQRTRVLLPTEVERHLKLLWERQGGMVLRALFGGCQTPSFSRNLNEIHSLPDARGCMESEIKKGDMSLDGLSGLSLSSCLHGVKRNVGQHKKRGGKYTARGDRIFNERFPFAWSCPPKFQSAAPNDKTGEMVAVDRETASSLVGPVVRYSVDPAQGMHSLTRPPSYRIFLLRTLMVPPSRFRPPRMLGGQRMVNGQTKCYSAIVQWNQRIKLLEKYHRCVMPYLTGEQEVGEVEVEAEVGVNVVRRRTAGNPKDTVDARVRAKCLQIASRLQLQPHPVSRVTPVTEGEIFEDKLSSWLMLQAHTTAIMDSEKSSLGREAEQGLRQVIDRKFGIVRRRFMGKRVNFSARSVLAPDPFLATNEIGVPLEFALGLSVPETVTHLNYEQMAACVVRGAKEYPGALRVRDEWGITLDLSVLNREQRKIVASLLLSKKPFPRGTDSAQRKALQFLVEGGDAGDLLTSKKGPRSQTHKTVFRHMRTGDAVLMNRQPSLHRPSIMGHLVRVLPNQRTFRMHYANCKSYNADFDGDELNMHLPQSVVARTEISGLALTDYNYIVPSTGAPIRGLIQDHVVSGVLLCNRDTFFTRAEAMQLLAFALCNDDDPCRGGGFESGGAHLKRINLPRPAILKPRPLYTGKQIVSAVLDFIVSPKPAITTTGKAKVPAAAWAGLADEESQVVIVENELLCGVLDKAQFGASSFGMVHAVHELCGPRDAGLLLSMLSRLFSAFLQSFQGFTCGIEDMLLQTSAEEGRQRILENAITEGIAAARDFAEVKLDDGDIDSEGKLTSAASDQVRRALRQRIRMNPETQLEKLDAVMKSNGSRASSGVLDLCLPRGQLKPFPQNCMALMTLSGAKGSKVNFSQICCLLGQQDLEGKRVPLMVNGKTLPSFPAFDPDPRAGGFVGDRFLSGLRPQEYYFHCMGGRDGLVDTAVKTASSGYLTRCLVKHLENLQVGYDFTVRDADGSIVQFLYGDDGVDPCRAAYQDRFEFMARNVPALVEKLNPVRAASVMDLRSAAALKKKNAECNERCDPVLASLSPGRYLGACSDTYEEKLDAFWKKECESGKAWDDRTEELDEQHTDFFKALKKVHKKYEKQQAKKAKKSGKQTSSADLRPNGGGFKGVSVPALAKFARDTSHKSFPALQDFLRVVKGETKLQRTPFMSQLKMKPASYLSPAQRTGIKPLMYLNYVRSLVHPGDSVGVLAAQAIGEPSTQMTLNTFHLAGHGGANVTLGIPRLREIIREAPNCVKTPLCEAPLRIGTTKEQAESIKRTLAGLPLRDLVYDVECEQRYARLGDEVFAPKGSATHQDGFHEVRFVIRLRYDHSLATSAPSSPVEFLRGIPQYILHPLLTRVDKKQKKIVLRERAAGLTSRTQMTVWRKKVDQSESPLEYDDFMHLRAGAGGTRWLRDKVRRGAGKSASDENKEEDPEDEEVTEDPATGQSKQGKKKQKKQKNGAESGSEDEGSESESDKDISEGDASETDEDTDGEGDDASGSEQDLSPVDMTHEDDSGDREQTTAVDPEMFDPSLLTPAVVEQATDDGGWFHPMTSVGHGPFDRYLGRGFGRGNLRGFRLHPESGVMELCVGLGCEFADFPMLSVVEDVLDTEVFGGFPGINEVFLVEQKLRPPYPKGLRRQYVLQMASSNIEALWEVDLIHPGRMLLPEVKSNDVSAVLRTFGVEAARACIVEQIVTVFAVYGVHVDPRHVNLVADYQTFRGGYTPMSRQGMTESASVLQRMSFEMSTVNMVNACSRRDADPLNGPSARIFMGLPPKCGTGSFDLHQQVNM